MSFHSAFLKDISRFHPFKASLEMNENTNPNLSPLGGAAPLYPFPVQPQHAVAAGLHGMFFYVPYTDYMNTKYDQLYMKNNPLIVGTKTAHKTTTSASGNKHCDACCCCSKSRALDAEKATKSSSRESKFKSRKSKKPTSTESSTFRRVYVDKVNDMDVLCGRGGRSNHHVGNKKYRQVVKEMKMKYKSTDGKLAKTSLSWTIVEHVKNYGGRFLKKDEINGEYYVLTPKEARRKSSQALREATDVQWTLEED